MRQVSRDEGPSELLSAGERSFVPKHRLRNKGTWGSARWMSPGVRRADVLGMRLRGNCKQRRVLCHKVGHLGFRCQGEAVVDDGAVEGVACCGVEVKAPGPGDSRNSKARPSTESLGMMFQDGWEELQEAFLDNVE